MTKRDILELILRGAAILALIAALGPLTLLLVILAVDFPGDATVLIQYGIPLVLALGAAAALWLGAKAFAGAVEDSPAPVVAVEYGIARRLLFAGIGAYFLLTHFSVLLHYGFDILWPTPEGVSPYVYLEVWLYGPPSASQVARSVVICVVSIGMILGTKGVKNFGTWLWPKPEDAE